MLNRVAKVLAMVVFSLVLGVAAPAGGCGCGSTPQDDIEGIWGGTVSFPAVEEVEVVVTFDYDYGFSIVAQDGADGTMVEGLSLRGSYAVDYESLTITAAEVWSGGIWQEMGTAVEILLPFFAPEADYEGVDNLPVRWVNEIDFDGNGSIDATWLLTRVGDSTVS